MTGLMTPQDRMLPLSEMRKPKLRWEAGNTARKQDKERERGPSVGEHWAPRPSLGKPGRLGEQSLLETRACFKEETESPVEAEGTAQDLPGMGAHPGRCWGAQPPA